MIFKHLRLKDTGDPTLNELVLYLFSQIQAGCRDYGRRSCWKDCVTTVNLVPRGRDPFVQRRGSLLLPHPLYKSSGGSGDEIAQLSTAQHPIADPDIIQK